MICRQPAGAMKLTADGATSRSVRVSGSVGDRLEIGWRGVDIFLANEY